MKKQWLRAIGIFLTVCMLFTAVPVAAENRQAAQFEVTDLTTEYLKNPVGIDADKVRLGWEMVSNVIGTKQTAYQVQVFEEDSQNPVWNSQKVESGQSTGIVCDAKLQEATSYRWEVTVWNEKGDSVKEGASFETGVTNQQEWKSAEFICMNASAAAPIFRTEQALDAKTVKKARLYITALGAYEAYVNGNRVGEFDEDGKITYHHMNPGYGNKTVSLGYQTYDITPFLSDDTKAAISVVAGNGWYSGMGTTTSSPAVKALAVIEYADGDRQVIQTNTTDWKGTLSGGIIGNGIYHGEDYNASFAEALGDFTQVGYDDSTWVNAEGSETKDYLPCIKNQFQKQNASYVRILVNETGPAQSGVNEHFLQIMELELLNAQGNNVVAGKVPQVSDTWSPNNQWAPEHLTDGDYGDISDYGYTTTLFGNQGWQSYTLSSPISITFQLGEKVDFEVLKMYPRTAVESVSQYECANYPKNYTLQVSNDGRNWSDVDTYSVDAVRNSVLFPEAGVISYGTDFRDIYTAKHVRISVSQTGSAVKEDNENRLQIMELELLNGSTNVARGVVPTISNNFEAGAQWNAANMTDGSYGVESDAGYTSAILGFGQTYLELDEPITIQFNFDHAVSFSEMKIYPRTGKEALSYGLCVNYPKVYTVQISDDGVTWRDIAVNQDAGMVRNTNLLENTRMTTVTYPGVIRAQAGVPGKLIDTFDQSPVSVVLYTGTKPNSSYPGGEVAVDATYTAVAGENIFEDGIALKKGQTMVVNMGQNLSAVPNIQFEAPETTVATLRFAEMLNDGSSVGTGATQADGPKGSIYQKSIRAARSAVTYFFAGNGVETYQPSMSFFGYQYVEITATNDITVYGLTSKAISSVTDQTGTIKTNNENVNKLFSNVIYGQLSNYYTTPTDCNQRDERLSWTGDTQAFAQTAVYNFDSVAFLNDMQDIYNENVWIKGYVPGVADDLYGFFSPWAAGWSDVEIIVPWTLYQQTGDISMLTDSWDAMNHYMDYLKANERGINQAPAFGNQNYGDWLAFQGTCIEVMNDYYYGYMNQLMAKIAGIIGNEAKVAQYNQKFEAIKEKFLATHVEFTNGNLLIKSNVGDANLHFMTWTDKKGVLEANSQTALLWMLKLGFYNSKEMKEAALELLLENVKNENPNPNSVRARYGKNTLAVGFLGSNIITPVLTESGNADVSYDLLLQDGQPSWLFEVKAGATTIWERWNSYTPGVGFGDSEMNSFNHYAYGSVVEWMYRYMAGIAADENNPGFKNIILQPTMDTGVQYNDEERINAVNAAYNSYYGDIVSEWTSSEGKLTTYHTEVPANTTATLYLPIEESAMDGFIAPDGVTFENMEAHNGQMTAKILLESGGYEFAVENGKLAVTYADGYEDSSVEKKLPFTDVKEGAWYYEAVYNNYFADLMTGKSETIFAPKEALTRAQFAMILYRIEGEPDVTSDKKFDDVSANSWYTDAVLWAYEAGIITGYANTNNFGPHDMIMREQMAVMMYRYAKTKNPDIAATGDLSKFADVGKVGGYAEDAMKWAVGAGIITGKDEVTLDPRGNTIRGEAAVVIDRFMDTYAQ